MKRLILKTLAAALAAGTLCAAYAQDVRERAFKVARFVPGIAQIVPRAEIPGIVRNELLIGPARLGRSSLRLQYLRLHGLKTCMPWPRASVATASIQTWPA